MLIITMLVLYLFIVLISLRCCMGAVRQQFGKHGIIAEIMFAVLFLGISSVPIWSALLKTSDAAPIRRVGNLWLYFGLYVLFGFLLWEMMELIFIRRRLKKKRTEGIRWRKVGVIVAAVVLLLTYGVLHAGRLKTVCYTVPEGETQEQIAEQGSNDMRIAFVADLHLGCQVGTALMTRMVDRINEMDPDLVLFGGDMFDSDYDMLKDPEEIIKILQGIHSRYGVYGVYGNHDVKETLIGGFSATPHLKPLRDQRMAAFLEECHITMLEDEEVSIADGQVRLIGRLDGNKIGTDQDERLTVSELLGSEDDGCAAIVLEHEPSDLEELSELGVDLVLSGHTHAGQFFPLTLAQPLIWENAYGIKSIGDMYSIVTSGVGVYGPPIRLLTDSEVVQIDWHYNMGGDK